ncbi:MAG TPA: coproporphyrinogen dehydrogenase HemZ [Candidatus Faecousia intestinigallinarum]|nr:coproporphyrinogen dehydrogenase HemZ [Candidatus Faecousia intestinigallinarum]
MLLTLTGHNDRYAVEQLQLALFSANAEGEAVSTLYRGKKWLTAVTKITKNGKTTQASKRLPAAQETVPLRRQTLQQSYYLAALPHLTQLPAWGALAGVRPTKLTTRHLLQGGTAASAKKMMERTYFVTPERAALAVDCSQATVSFCSQLEPTDISLYVGIPFCPTRCAYCSFVSRTVGRHGDQIAPYLEALLQEIAHTGKLLANSPYRIRTLYIGGGTPTTLTSPQLERLVNALYAHFDLSRCLEFTVEGGRPDTLDLPKLQTLRRLGVDRMSINPQTMEDAVLRACGRPHTAQDTLRAYGQAVEAGFAAINMDLIAGLPQDSFDGFRRSLDAVAERNPANITVHTLALKKDADLFSRRQSLPPAEEVARMVDYAGNVLRGLGYRPYYLYRQKYMSGNFENVGWSRDGLHCLYNIAMMEEVHTILSLGGGGISKVNLPGGKLIRFPNPKFPEQYLEQLRGVLSQKEDMFAQMKGSV